MGKIASDYSDKIYLTNDPDLKIQKKSGGKG